MTWPSSIRLLSANEGGGTIEVNGVSGYLSIHDLSFLFRLGAELIPGGTLVEIGSWMGLSAIAFANGALASGNATARIFCVDTWSGSAEHQDLAEVTSGRLYEMYLRNIKASSVGALITPLRGDSSMVAQNWDRGAIDALFIDGDHSFDACLRDLEMWAPHLGRSGRILGHDATPGSGVAEAVTTYARKVDRNAIVLPTPSSCCIWEIVDRTSTTRPEWSPLV